MWNEILLNGESSGKIVILISLIFEIFYTNAASFVGRVLYLIRMRAGFVPPFLKHPNHYRNLFNYTIFADVFAT